MAIVTSPASAGNFSAHSPLTHALLYRELSNALLDLIISCVARGDIERALRIFYSFRIIAKNTGGAS